MIVGTAAYMAPEQARGKAVDKRADIWAFGVILFEMLSGKRFFEGDTISDVLAAVLRADIDWRALPASVPAEVRRLLVRCLDREPKNRLHDIADARIVIDETLRGGSTIVEAPPQIRRSPRWLTALPWALAALAVATAIGVSWRSRTPPATALRPTTTFGILLPPEHFLTVSQSPIINLSADGRALLFVAEGPKGSGIFRRSFDRMSITRIEGTGGAENPVLSPDGRWIAFFSGGSLRKVAADGGTACRPCQGSCAARRVLESRWLTRLFAALFQRALPGAGQRRHRGAAHDFDRPENRAFPSLAAGPARRPHGDLHRWPRRQPRGLRRVEYRCATARHG